MQRQAPDAPRGSEERHLDVALGIREQELRGAALGPFQDGPLHAPGVHEDEPPGLDFHRRRHDGRHGICASKAHDGHGAGQQGHGDRQGEGESKPAVRAFQAREATVEVFDGFHEPIP
jgi:hypothetical protein